MQVSKLYGALVNCEGAFLGDTMPRSLVVDSRVTIPAEELQLTFARSSGPGGQNVNKVNSKAVLRWSIVTTSALSREVIDRFIRLFPTRVTKQGEVVIASDRSRDQAQNVANCREVLRDLLRAAIVQPRKRKITKPSRAAIERRLREKEHQSEKKSRRSFRTESD